MELMNGRGRRMSAVCTVGSPEMHENAGCERSAGVFLPEASGGVVHNLRFRAESGRFRVAPLQVKRRNQIEAFSP
jgi:hypothetical protein